MTDVGQPLLMAALGQNERFKNDLAQPQDLSAILGKWEHECGVYTLEMSPTDDKQLRYREVGLFDEEENGCPKELEISAKLTCSFGVECWWEGQVQVFLGSLRWKSTSASTAIHQFTFSGGDWCHEIISKKVSSLSQLSPDNRKERFVAICDRQPNLRVIKGAPIQDICIGAQPDMRSFGQLPPAHGDSWELDFETEPGAYEVSLLGGGNPHHGIASVSIDDISLGVMDQYMPTDTFPVKHSFYWEGAIDEKRKHTLRIVLDDKRPDSENYWFCVHQLNLVPVPIRRPLLLTLQLQETSESTAEASALNLSGAEVAKFIGPASTSIADVRAFFASELDADTWPPVAHVLSLVLPSGQLLLENDDTMALFEFT